jgi:hypothetical protein
VYASRSKATPIYPPSSSDWTPSGNACTLPGKRFPARSEAWERSPWTDLGISVDQKSAWQFRTVRTGTGAHERYLIEARADRDCNGRWAHLAIALDDQRRPGPMQIDDENE